MHFNSCFGRPQIALASLLFLTATGGYGQTAPPAFDVASVKPSASEQQPAGNRGGFAGLIGGGPARRGTFSTSPGSLTVRNATLSGCIQWAYGVQEYQIAGPNWLTADRFDIMAKAEGAANEDQLKLMLETLLAERFKLAFHKQQKELQAYALVVAKNGPKLRESTTEGPGNIRRGRMGVTVEGATLDQLADALSQVLQIPVFDATGLKGRYDATVDIAPYIPYDGSGPTDIVGIAIVALQDLLGLKLEARKGPLEMLVIDHVERVPIEP